MTDELFDLTTMAMEYFKEHIEPNLPEITYFGTDFFDMSTAFSRKYIFQYVINLKYYTTIFIISLRWYVAAAHCVNVNAMIVSSMSTKDFHILGQKVGNFKIRKKSI